ncbi:MAG: hypothetical protein JWP67_302 [Mucilaginibacter sp.]|nr:hypothetical protein [Mucilaginibacter sp.]
MKERVLKISFCLLSLILFATLILKFKNLPGGMILPGYFLGGMVLVLILLGSVVVGILLKLIFKKHSFITLYSISTSIAFSFFHYFLYSPTLKITIPHGYKGQVNLILSNVKDNILTLDSNGIGYINQWTFDHTYTIPEVTDKKGRNVNSLCVGFSHSNFWGKEKSCCIGKREIESLVFEVVPVDKADQKQYYSKDLTGLANKSLLIFTKSDY